MRATIVQLSDPHLFGDPQAQHRDVTTAASFAAVVAHARRVAPDCDAVVLTGDLCHDPSPEGYEAVRQALGDWLDRTLVIAGNHDDLHMLGAVFGRPEANGDAVCFRSLIGDRDWQLIGVDSVVPGETHGWLDEEQLQQLDAWLAEDPARPTLLFLHHPPIALGSAWLDPLLLRNPEQLAGRLPGSGVRAMFCGHAHTDQTGELAGIPVHVTPSTAFQFVMSGQSISIDPSPPGFRVIRIDDDRLATEVVRLA